ncbi:MlaD family protein [Paracoccus jiaweipingae]|uniref:MlaD family protein n=1 Tax=unclassified Paracoccus (in: a-proteobacteria) TaxID=2688777 RepID=UPI00378F334F
METKANYVLIGAFTLAGFLGLLLFLMWFAKIELDRQFDYYDVDFPEVSGLAIASDVRFAGLSVGQVVDMRLSPRHDGTVRVRLEVREGTPVRVDSRASVDTQGVTGVSNVGITAGSPDAGLLNDAQPDGVPIIPATRSVLQTLGDQGPEMIERLNTVAEQLTRLLGAENQTRVANILTNVERSSGNLDAAIADISSATDSIASAAGDISAFGQRLDGLSAAATTTLSKADAALDQFTRSASRADATLDSATATLDQARDYISGDLKTLTARLDDTAASLQTDLSALTGRAQTSLDGLDAAMVAAGRTFEGADKVINKDIGPITADLRETMSRLGAAADRLADELPGITEGLKNAADSADAAFSGLRAMLDKIRGPVQSFATDGLAQITPLGREMRSLVANMNQLVATLRRNPSQILSGPKQPDFRR